MTGSLSYQQRIERKRTITEGYFRSPSRRDRDRLRYSRYFRRLSGVTQVTHSEEAQLYHNRLTHSLKVAQVASALARMFLIREGIDPNHCDGRSLNSHNQPDENSLATSLDPYVVEAAAHAHDMGHPPFGHCGEKVLDDLVAEESNGVAGFEGNAQSFHIVTQLAPHDPDQGCNLTRATLNATLKYPWDRSADAAKDDDGEPNKWGYYTDPGTDDEAVFEWVRRPLSNREEEKVLEAQIMDWADDITYAIHDLQDFFGSGLIPIDELISEAVGCSGSRDPRVNELALSTDDKLVEFESFLEEESDVDVDEFNVSQFFTDLAENTVDDPEVIMRPFTGTAEERSKLKKFTSRLVTRYMEAKRKNNPQLVKLVQDGDHYNLELHSRYEDEIEVLKSLTRYYVISNPTLMQLQHGQEKVLRNLYTDLMNEAEKTMGSQYPRSAIPSPYQERVKQADETNEPLYRIVSDLIATLTEQQALMLHKRLRGWIPDTIQKDITN